MNIEDIEKSLGSFSSSPNKVLEYLMYLSIENNSYLKAIFENQIKVNYQLDPSKSMEEYKDELTKRFKEIDQETFNFIMRTIESL